MKSTFMEKLWLIPGYPNLGLFGCTVDGGGLGNYGKRGTKKNDIGQGYG